MTQTRLISLLCHTYCRIPVIYRDPARPVKKISLLNPVGCRPVRPPGRYPVPGNRPVSHVYPDQVREVLKEIELGATDESSLGNELSSCRVAQGVAVQSQGQSVARSDSKQKYNVDKFPQSWKHPVKHRKVAKRLWHAFKLT